MSGIACNVDEEADTISPLLIGIAGGPCSGKTSIANSIARYSGVDVQVIQMDWFRDRRKPIGPNSYNIEHLINIIQRLKNRTYLNTTLDITIYVDGENNEVVTIPIKCTPVVIIEGPYAFYDQRLAALTNIRMFIDCDADIRLCRAIKQVEIQSSAELESMLRCYMDIVAPLFDKWIVNQRPFADIIINNNDNKGTDSLIINSIMLSTINCVSTLLQSNTDI